MTEMTHTQRQQQHFDRSYGEGVRSHITTDDPMVRWIVRWRLREALQRLGGASAEVTLGSRLLVMCAGDALEGSILCDEGFRDVTISDISKVGVEQATERDPRMTGLVLNAESANLEDCSYDVVVVQDGLHHLQNPVLGFTEMLRVARVAAFFLEPHNSLAGRKLGRTWEIPESGDAPNYVFRWTRRLVSDVAFSYLGQESHVNLSFSFWHHNIMLERLGKRLGGGERAIHALRVAKGAADRAVGRLGNQFCGLVVKTPRH